MGLRGFRKSRIKTNQEPLLNTLRSWLIPAIKQQAATGVRSDLLEAQVQLQDPSIFFRLVNAPCKTLSCFA
jgi:hypothetical protein